METLSELKKVETLKSIPDNQLQWLIDNSEPYQLKAGEFLFQPGDEATYMYVVFEGQFKIKFQQGRQFKIIANIEPYSVSGMLPYSRATNTQAYAEATRESQILRLHKDHFKQMIVKHEELTTALVHHMSTRIREFTKMQQQNDKMMALGKLSAGLAHELNNPSAAVVRSAQTLKQHLSALPEKFKKVVEIRMNPQEIDNVNNILFSKLDKEIPELSMMEKSNREEEFLDWLEERDIEEPDEIAENMVEFGFTEEDLEQIDEDVPEENLDGVMNWVNQVLTTEKLVSEIEDAAKRINDLVSSVKSYTHMDQSPEKKLSPIHEGLENTLTMMGHKMRKENIQIEKKYEDTPLEAEVLPSALNQVWTNLIDNAIDAMKKSDSRTLTVETQKDGDFINVNIHDTGSGIPEEIKDQIFDPFFTTKDVGEGTGIGLELVHRIITRDHHGSIKVDSEPGHTVFKVCFPAKA